MLQNELSPNQRKVFGVYQYRNSVNEIKWHASLHELKEQFVVTDSTKHAFEINKTYKDGCIYVFNSFFQAKNTNISQRFYLKPHWLALAVKCFFILSQKTDPISCEALEDRAIGV